MDLIRFYRAIPDARTPAVADKSAAGAMPTKAYRYCEPMRAASGYGWYLFLPHDIALRWNGHTQVEWWFGEEYGGVLNGDHVEAIQYPDFAGLWDYHASRCEGYSPPFVTALQEPGLVQIWTGWLVRTMHNWSVLVRPVANRPRPANLEPYEGIIETDRWFGPLFTNLRLAKTDEPIRIPAHRPLFQLQPIPRAAYQGPVTFQLRPNLNEWDSKDWSDYYDTMVKPHAVRGQYAVESRQRPPHPPEEV